MDERTVFRLKHEEDEDEFKSCFGDEDELGDKDFKGNISLDDDHVNIYFKGVSVAGPENSCSSFSGIGVVIQRPGNVTGLQVQKQLDFYVEELVAEYLALIDGLSLAIENDARKISVFTDSEVIHNQLINDEEIVKIPLLEALRKRILEQVSDMEAFVLKLVPETALEKALYLARVAVGLVSIPVKGDNSTEICSICSKERLKSMMLSIRCSHKFCSHCMRRYVIRKLKCCEFPIKCPELECKECISLCLCKSFLTAISYESLEKALADGDLICCPYSNCLAILDPRECWSARDSYSNQYNISCMECYVCNQLMCRDCSLPWHSSLTCQEYGNLPEDERVVSDLTMQHLLHNRQWRFCQQCHGKIELNNGCYHMRCWCGHEFCYTCGAEYREGEQTCECPLWDADYSADFKSYPSPNTENWTWDSLPNPYSEHERSQLALIQRFLSGGYTLSDQDSYQALPRCTDSYAETMKDLHQLPWLERFVSVITDDYYEGYNQ